jgi:hypothetical protein
MYAAASRHTKDSSRLREYAREIDKNKALKIAVGSGAALREYFLLRPGTYDNELVSLGKPGAEARLADRLQNSRAVSGRGDWLILGDVPIWHLAGPNFNRVLRTGPRSSQRRAAELRYEGVQSKSFRGEPEGPKQPTILSTAARGRRITVKATIDQSAVPADWKTISREPSKGGAEVGVGFAMKRVVPDGGIERGAPLITVGYGVLVGDAQVHLVQITRDGEHNIAVKRLAEAAVGAGRGKRALEVKVDPGNVSVTVDGKRVSFPWKPEGGDADGFAGFIFDGVGYASLAQPTVTVAGN